MIEKIENLDTLKRRLESAYDSYSQNGDFTLLDHWKSYLNQFPDQIDFCINVLLNKEKEKQYGVLQPSKMHRSNSELFLRDSVKNLTVKILLHVISHEEDKEYFEARKRNVDAIQAKLTELCLSHDDFSDDELSAPKKIRDKASRGKIEALKTFLATLPDPILQSKRLLILLKHLSKIDLTNINWLDKIFVLISSSNKRSYVAQQESLQEKEQPVERFLQPNETTKKNLTFLLEHQKLQQRYPKKGEAEARFFRYFLWHCKNEGLDAVATGKRFRDFLTLNGLDAAFTDYKNVAKQFPLIKTGMHSADFLAQTEDSATVMDHQTLSFGEDMTQDEKRALLRKLNVTCCFANQSGLMIKTTETHQAFFVTRNRENGYVMVSPTQGNPEIEGIKFRDIEAGREIFVMLVSGDTPISKEEMKALLVKNPLPVETLSTQLVQEISTENGKAPIAISILPIDRNSKKLQYAGHIPGDDKALAKDFQERLEAQTDFDYCKKLKKEVEQLTQRTQDYLLKLEEELTSEKQAFLNNHPGSLINSDSEDGEVRDVHISGLNIDEEAQREFDTTIGEKAKVRFEVAQTLKKLKSNNKTSLEKLRDFSENLFEEKQENVEVARVAHPNMEAVEGAPWVVAAKPVSLAKRIENTATGYDYLKAALRTLAAFSIIFTIPTIAYCISTHRWPWQTEGKGLLRQTKETRAHFQTKLQR